MSLTPRGNRATTGEIIAGNLIWTFADLAASIATLFIVNIGMARVFGPVQLGYFNLVFWLTNMTGQVGSLGLPATTGKYMAECIGSDRKALARSIFFYSLRLQAICSCVVTGLGIGAVLLLARVGYRTTSLFLVLSLLPQMLAFIPSQANNAREDARSNLPGSVVGSAVLVAIVLISLLANWGLLGVAIGVCVSRTVELAIKLANVLSWIRHFDRIRLPRDFKQRLLRFSGLSTGIMLVQIVVWDRSDIVLLKLLQSDIRQIAFFSVAFGLADRLQRIPQTIGSAVALTQLAEYGRDRIRLSRITATTAKYIFILAAPMLLTASAISRSAVYTLYGTQYLEAAPVFVLVAIFALPKTVIIPAQTMLYSAEDLAFLFNWSLLCGAINVISDCLLIPTHGALGAAIGNGTAQTIAAAGIWFRTVKRHGVKLDWPVFAKAGAAALALALLVAIVTHTRTAPSIQFVLSIAVAVIALPISLRAFRVLTNADGKRARLLLKRLPVLLQQPLSLLVDLAVVKTAT